MQAWFEQEVFEEIVVFRPVGLGIIPGQDDGLAGQAGDDRLLPLLKRGRVPGGRAGGMGRPGETDVHFNAVLCDMALLRQILR